MRSNRKRQATTLKARLAEEQPAARKGFVSKYAAVAEIGAIALWAIFVGRGYLDLNPNQVPTGGEFGAQTQSNHIWTQFERCGWCAVWNGFEQGGLPAFVDVQGSMLHPVTAVATLVFGVVNGAKVIILVALWLAGVAQWWIAREFKLGLMPRLWSAAIAVAGGHLASRMETGNFQLILSTVAGSLVLAGVLHLARHGGRRSAVLLGILIASALLAGQGYMQIGLLGLTPALIAFFFEGRERSLSWLGDFALALGISILLAAPLLVPVAHFLPNFAKEADPGTFGAAQPLAYLPLNLLINDFPYYYSNILEKLPYPQLYALYIGWIPLLLAVFGLSTMRREDRRLTWFMITAILLSFVWASAIVFRAFHSLVPSLGNVRFPSVIAALAVPLTLGFSACGLERLISLSRTWPKLAFNVSGSSTSSGWQLPLQWFLIIPLVLSIQSVHDFARHWYQSTKLDDKIIPVLNALKTDSLQWVEPPFGALGFLEPGIAMDLKLSPGFSAVEWRGRPIPQPVLYASFSGQPPGTTGLVTTVAGVAVYAAPGNYAQVDEGTSQEACSAEGSGGQIKVECNTSQPGRLVLQEHTWTGWYAWLDGKSVPLLGSDWLEVDAPAGPHVFEFRYLPWDVPLGLALCILGLALSLWLWWRPLPFFAA